MIEPMKRQKGNPYYQINDAHKTAYKKYVPALTLKEKTIFKENPENTGIEKLIL